MWGKNAEIVTPTFVVAESWIIAEALLLTPMDAHCDYLLGHIA